jgi:uncharacterized membrane protein
MKRPVLWAEQRAATALEFAMIASVFVPLCLASLDVGLLLWSKGILQSAAAGAARCAAIASSACSNLPQFAVTLAGNWSFPGMIAVADVVGPTLVCVAPLQYAKVSITGRHWSNGVLPAWSATTTLSAVAYFPTGASC